MVMPRHVAEAESGFFRLQFLQEREKKNVKFSDGNRNKPW